MTTAFQPDAFQNNAFQIDTGSNGGSKWYLRKKKARKEFVNYIQAKKVLETTGLELEKKRLEAAVKPFLTEQPKTEQMIALLQNELARKKFERIIKQIRQIEMEMAELLAVLLLAEEEL